MIANDCVPELGFRSVDESIDYVFQSSRISVGGDGAGLHCEEQIAVGPWEVKTSCHFSSNFLRLRTMQQAGDELRRRIFPVSSTCKHAAHYHAAASALSLPPLGDRSHPR
jgi:hypothetical protein